jgi:hypothetical protein
MMAVEIDRLTMVTPVPCLPLPAPPITNTGLGGQVDRRELYQTLSFAGIPRMISLEESTPVGK